ncbi:MAG: cyclic nucleotide-binding domain-containing protein [Elusimicrobia bacterium]|nr:cyclic nucleotide-binding domain-containing protein [Elusimicrobiota bacterium]
MPNDDTIFLKTKVDILSFFNEDQLRRVTPDIERKSYASGEMIVLRGEVTSGFYIIKKGKVSANSKEKDGSARKQDLNAGDFFGVMSLLENQSSDATIKAAEDGTEVLTIPAASFQKLLEMQPLLKKSLLDKVAASRKS